MKQWVDDGQEKLFAIVLQSFPASLLSQLGKERRNLQLVQLSWTPSETRPQPVWAMEIQYWFPIQKMIYSGYRFSMWIWRLFFYSLCIFGVPAVKDVVWDLLIFILVLRVKHLPFSAGWVALGTTWNRGFECKCLWSWRLLWCLVGLRPIEEIQLPSLY